MSKVTSTHKAESKSDLNNYRPISVLPCLSKILERSVHRQLMEYLEKHHLLKDSQFGFRPDRSTELITTLFLDDIRKNVDSGKLTGVIFLDLSKAFDTVSHSSLLSKLPSYGISGMELSWFESYLFNQKQQVNFNGCLSEEYPVYNGVPQGSILGPTLFVLHLDDIDNCLRHCNIIKYADDTVIYVPGRNSLEIQNKLNEDISKVCKWLTTNDLSLNLKKGKTETMLFGTAIRINKADPLDISINGINLNQTNSYKYLGVQLDPTLTLNDNFQMKYKKLSTRLRLMSKLRPHLTTKAAESIYKSIVVPVFTYCGTVDLNLTKTETGKLYQIHRRAVTIINRNDNQNAKISPITTLVKRRACQLVRKCINEKLPPPMNMYFEIVSHTKCTRNNGILIMLPKVRTKAAQNGFFYQGGLIYNSLPKEIRAEQIENKFLQNLHKFVF